MKRAALLFRVGIQLYDRTTQAADQQQQYAQNAAAALDSPAQPFQIQAVVNYFEGTCRLDRTYWTSSLGITSPEALTARAVTDILTGAHPFVQYLKTLGFGGNPAAGLRATNA